MQEPVANASAAITPNGPSTQPNSPKPKKKGRGWRIAGIIFLLLLLGAAGAGGYYYLQILQEQQREEEMTNIGVSCHRSRVLPAVPH